MKKEIFLVLILFFNLQALADCQNSNVLAKQFVEKIFDDSIALAQVKENSNLEYHAYTNPADNIIEVKNIFSDNECKVNLVHEYTHRMRYKYQINDIPWFSEGLAQLIEMLYTNWPKTYNEFFLTSPYFKISNMKTEYINHSRTYPESFFLFHYIYSHFGNHHLLKKIMKSSKTGWDNILSSIRELQVEQKISIGESIVTREFIIKHFAIALAVNDPYLADYRLFQIHQSFESVIKQQIQSIDLETEYLNNIEAYDFNILFTKRKIKNDQNFDFFYSIESLDPLNIKLNSSDEKNSLLYIYIKL